MRRLPHVLLSFSAFLSFPHIPYHNRLSESVVTDYLKTNLVHMLILITYGEYLEPTEWGIYPSRSLFPLHFEDQSQCICEGLLSVCLGIYQELPFPVLCLPVCHSLKAAWVLQEYIWQNDSDPIFLCCVVVPVWFCNWDRLIPSGEDGYLLLPLSYWLITKSLSRESAFVPRCTLHPSK